MRFKETVLSLAALACIAGAVTARADLSIGKLAPALVVKDLQGRVFDLQAARGKWVIVSFWAQWCTPCREEMPMLNAFYRAHRGRHLAMIGLSVDGGSEMAKARKLAQKLSYPAAFYTEATQNGFDAPDMLPETVVIRPDGTVGAVFTGEGLTTKKLAAALSKRAGQ